MHQPRATFTLYSLARLMLPPDVTALTRAHSGVYIADLPGKRQVIVGPSGWLRARRKSKHIRPPFPNLDGSHSSLQL